MQQERLGASRTTSAVGGAPPERAVAPGSPADRGRRLFEFLAAAQRLKATRVRTTSSYDQVLWMGDLPDHPAVSSAHRSAVIDAGTPLLVVRRLPAVPAPEVPEPLRPWLDGPADEPGTEPALLDAIPDPDADQHPEDQLLLHRSAVPEVTIAHTRWRAEWVAWSGQELQDRSVRDLYKSLFATYVTVTGHTESVELVLGVGVLAWSPPEHFPVKRHVLTSAATIAFDDDSGDLSIDLEPTGDVVSLELDMLEPSLLPSSSVMSDIRASVHDFDDHPLSRDDVGRLVRRVVHSLEAGSSYDEDGEIPPQPTNDPRAAFAPALIVRKRSATGLIAIFDQIAQHIAVTGDVPAGLAPLIDPDHTPSVDPDPSPGAIVSIDGDDDVFLPLPLNDVQLSIIRRADRHAQTLVQGPPGTGKTHTAAALITHLLAQGRRVLVTAHTDRALHEVRSKLPESIKPLAVAVIGAERSDMADLKVAVEGLSARSSAHDPDEARRAIQERLASIDAIRRRRADVRGRLVAARATEVSEHQHADYAGTLARVAEQYRAQSPTHQWILEHVRPEADAPPPLEATRAVRWLELLRDRALIADEGEAGERLVELDLLPEPRLFAAMVDAEAAGQRAQAPHHDLATTHTAFSVVSAMPVAERAQLQVRMRGLARRAHGLADEAGSWIDGALRDIRGRRGATWQARATDLHALITETRPYVELLGRATEVQILDPTADLGALMAHAHGLHAHLLSGAEVKTGPDGKPKIGAFTSKVVKGARPLFDVVRVDGRPLATLERVTAFMAHVDGTRRLNALDRAWPSSVEIPAEDTLRERLQWHVTEVEQLDALIVLGQELAREEVILTHAGLPHPDWNDLVSVLAYADLVDAAAAHETAAAAREPLERLEADASSVTRWADAAPASQRLLLAVRDRDRDEYAAAHARTVRLHAVRATTAERDHLTRTIAESARTLADAVLADPFDGQWDDRVPGISRAWDWARTGAWILAQTTEDLNVLQLQIRTLEDQLRRDVEVLAATRAWAHAVSPQRLTGRSKADLTQYAQLVRRLGKGTGRYAAARQAEIRTAMDRCRSAVPVWIMPIYRIAEQLRVSEDMFDVVIVDEASQAGLEATFLQFLAPKIIVIGDDKQVSPAAVGVDQQQMRDLAQQYLHDDPYIASWQDPKRSLFDEANMRFGSKLTLVEHRRCVPEIIGFSNRIAYEPENIRLLPVRQYGSDRLEPIRAVHVTDGYERGGTGSKTNPPEVDAIVEQVRKCLADPRYDDLTMGIISLQGSTQARRIESALLEVVSAEEWSARNLRCGDAADFQGSERDVVFLSMVSAPEDGHRLGAMTQEMYVQRFNVAASRARDQLWLFHSITLADLPNSADLRHHLIDYCYGVIGRGSGPAAGSARQVPDDARVEPFDSLFEQRVHNRIIDRGFTVIPQFPASGYRLDLVVVGAQGRLAIECDGDAWHGPTAFEADLARQRDLERCGWQFFRIRESAWYVDQHAVLEKLWAHLEGMDIRASDWGRGDDLGEPAELGPTAHPRNDDGGAAEVPVPDEEAGARVAPPVVASVQKASERFPASRLRLPQGPPVRQPAQGPRLISEPPPVIPTSSGKVGLSETARSRVVRELDLIAEWLGKPFVIASAGGLTRQRQVEDHHRRREELIKRQHFLERVVADSVTRSSRGDGPVVLPGSLFELLIRGSSHPVRCTIASIGDEKGVERISPTSSLGRAVDAASVAEEVTYDAPRGTMIATVVRVLD